MIIALAQINPLVGDIDGNCRKMATWIDKAAAQGADLVIFPELAVTGYPPKDLLLRTSFVERNIEALGQLAGKTRDGPAALVGFVDQNQARVGRPIHNALAFLQAGERASTYHKCLLPTYDVFDEHRYFEPGEKAGLVELKSRSERLLIGLTICEDLWNDDRHFARRLYHRDPIDDIDRAGAALIVNVSASPFTVNKMSFREQLMGGHASVRSTPLAMVNQVGGNDELIFDGTSCFFGATGKPVARAAAFEEDLLMVNLRDPSASRLTPYPQAIESVRKALVLGTRDYVHKCGFQGVVLGLSGGIDSAVTAAIAAEALGPDRIHGVALPSRYSSDHSIRDAEILASNLGIHFKTVPIKEIHEAFEQQLRPFFDGRPEDITEENIQARARGNILMSLSNKFGCLLMTTGNKSELAVGYCTLYGDMCGGLAVISDVPKTMVYELARHFNASAGREVIPESSITKPPSAELRPDQHDQQSLPPYEVLDAILLEYVEHEKSVGEIIAGGFDPQEVLDTATKVDRNEYKRKQAATGLKVTSRAFGVGRRMPIAARFTWPEQPPED